MLKYHRRYIDQQEQIRRWIDPRLLSVRVADIERYLRAHGWTEVAPDRPHTRVFREPGNSEGEPLYQFVPATDEYDNYGQQVFELVTALAVIEDRQAVDVLNDILSPSHEGANGAPAAPTREKSVP